VLNQRHDKAGFPEGHMYQFVESLRSHKGFLVYTGTTALFALLKAMDAGPDDEVITPVFTCPAVPTPVVRLEARPVYVDIDPGTFNIDPDKIEDRITVRTRVIIVQHTLGIPAEKDHVLDITWEESLAQPQSERVSHSLGNGKAVGKKIVPFQQKRLYRKLDGWDDVVAYRRWIMSEHEKFLSQIGCEPPQLNGHLEPIYYKYPLLSDRKSEIFEQARRARVEMSDMFGSPLYPPERRANWAALGYREGMCPISERTSDRIVALPVHTRILARDIERTFALLSPLLESSEP
jgi:dTDP-4-amino-4,6-dideoxygalactose transaminase